MLPNANVMPANHRRSFDQKLSFGFLLLLSAAGVYFTFLIARPFLAPIVAAALIAVAMQPLLKHLLRYVRNRSVAAFIVTAVLFLALLLPAVIFLNTLANETMAVYGWLNEQSSSTEGWIVYLSRLTERPIRWLETITGISGQQLRSASLGQFRNLSVWLVDQAKSIALNVTGTVVNTFVVLFTLFFMVRDGKSILDKGASILPLEPNRYNLLLKTISDSIVGNIYGVVAVSLSQGVLSAIGYRIAGLPNVMVWSVMTALFSMIPIAGAFAVWGVGVIYLGTVAQWGRALFLVVYGTAIISMADNIVRPLVLGGRVKMNTLVIFFSLIGGVEAFGIVGLFVGPIVVSVTMTLVKMLADQRAEWTPAAKKDQRTSP